jgi:nitric oxide reductase large subunit
MHVVQLLSFSLAGVGLSFSSVLLYGQEATLTIFELLFFAVIDLGSFNYVLDAIITYILMEVKYCIEVV